MQHALGWMAIHEKLGRLAKEKAVFEAEIGRSLLLGEREAVHRHLGFGTYADCDATHIGHFGRGPRRAGHGAETHVGPTRATKTIPPRVRRMVQSRDHHACVVPGCRSCVFVDVHHLDPRAEGGSHDPDNLVTLCCLCPPPPRS
jgi:hypothetical protein